MSTAPITMPTNLQSKMKNIGFSHENDPTAASFQTDTGPDKLRQRTTKRKDTYRCPVQLTDSEMDDLLEFFDTTTRGGTDPFNFTNPRDGVEGVYQFRNASLPTYNNETPGPAGTKTYTFTLILRKIL